MNNNGNENYSSIEDDLHNILEALRVQALNLERLTNQVKRQEKTLAENSKRLDKLEEKDKL